MGRELQSSIVDKCANVLDVLAGSQNTMSFTELVDSTGFTKSSTHRIITILLGEGMLAQDDRTKAYTLGPRVLGWARAAWQKTDLQQISDAELMELRDITGLNVAVSILTDESIMFIRTIDTTPVRYAAKVGEQSPLHCTAAGKLFLAHDVLVWEKVSSGHYELEKFTDKTITDPARMAKEMEVVRRRGYAVCDREEFLQVCGIAAPIFDYQAKIIAALSLWAPAKKATISDLEKQAPALTHAADRISSRFGAMT
ncbi:IclR family transcriptional regulator [Mameliella alba]|uniref:Putative calcium binding transcriptional regulatory protein n=1 Tax=Mameliella alba TaxID=561184 RepID=A0A0B3S4U0_9RHOB|nr:IclR family transcriptional regulator [Mameliella alba]KHQ51711.1 putative calcium binding transcriptional regulatory protein [Mameliella alba]